ncbi:MAG: hypothetical protein OHK0029_04150 [Armatimonadaceae bacterium]
MKRATFARAAALASLAFSSLFASIAPASANVIWGGVSVLPQPTVQDASVLAFSQFSPTTVNTYGTIPTTTNTTQFATTLVNNVNGSAKVVMMIRYSDGSVYAIVNDDANLAAKAASATDTVTLTGQFFFATENGATVLKQTIFINGVQTSTTWGNSSSITGAFTLPDGTARNVIWGGVSMYPETGAPPAAPGAF